MNEVVWVFGPSASGKETFLNNAKNEEIISLMNWQGKKIIPIEESVSFIKQNRKDPIGSKRLEILEKVVDLNIRENNAVMLIKGQNIDLAEGLFDLVNAECEDATQRIVFLTASNITLFKRMKQKPWLKDYMRSYFYALMHIVYTEGLVKNSGLPITTIDTTNGYHLSSFPLKSPELAKMAVNIREFLKKAL